MTGQPTGRHERVEITPLAEESATERVAGPIQQVRLVPESTETIGERLLPGVIWFLLILFGFGNLTSLALFWLNGFGITNLSDVALASLAAATIAEVTGLLTIAMKALAATL